MNPDSRKKNSTPAERWWCGRSNVSGLAPLSSIQQWTMNTTNAAGKRSGVTAGSRSRRGDMEYLGVRSNRAWEYGVCGRRSEEQFRCEARLGFDLPLKGEVAGADFGSGGWGVSNV